MEPAIRPGNHHLLGPVAPGQPSNVRVRPLEDRPDQDVVVGELLRRLGVDGERDGPAKVRGGCRYRHGGASRHADPLACPPVRRGAVTFPPYESGQSDCQNCCSTSTVLYVAVYRQFGKLTDGSADPGHGTLVSVTWRASADR